MREKHRRNHSRGASGENPRQNHSQRASGEKHEVKQQGYEDSEKKTKIWSDDEKNREEQSHQQAEEQSQRQARQEHSQQQAREEQSQRQAKQTKGPRTRQDELRGEAQYRGKLQPASPEASKNRYRCPAGAMRAEAWRMIATVPKIDFDEEIVEYKKIIQTAQDGFSQIRDREHSDGFFQLESRGSMKSAQQAKEAEMSFNDKKTLPPPRRISNRTLRTFW